MYIDLTLSMTQTALIVLKLLGAITVSWWLVFVPTFVVVIGGMIMAATDKEDKA